MNNVSIDIIQAAQAYDPDAVRTIFDHFEPYIRQQCQMRYEDDYGNLHTHTDEDLRYQAEIGLYAAIFRFQFQVPPDDFSM